MNTRAQIKRATLIGQRAIESLDAETQQALIELYRAQAEEIAAQIRAHAGPDGSLALQELRALREQIEAILRELAASRDALLAEALGKAADYGARPMLGEVTAGGAVVATAASMMVSQDALRFVQTFIAEDGLKLSDRIWRIDQGARERVIAALESAIIQGQGAGEAAADLARAGRPVPPEITAKIRNTLAEMQARRAQEALTGSASAGRPSPSAGKPGPVPAIEAPAPASADTGGPVASPVRTPPKASGGGERDLPTPEIMTGTGSPMDNAMRVMRTEINRAHGEAYIQGFMQHPDAAGLRYLLSPAHPKPDICDLLSTQNLYGLGAGVYPDRERLPWPAHPNTLSFVEGVFKDEISDADRAGKETPLQALARLTPVQRKGVLGKGKADIYDAGKLTQGMIRAPLGKVRERIGAMDTRDALTKQHFNGSDITLSGSITPRKIVDIDLTRADIPLLLGVPDGAKVHVKQFGNRIEMDATHPLYSAPQTAFITRDGVLHWDSLFLKDDAPPGMGTRIAGIMVETASAMGLREIQMKAWGPPYNGHYTWARMGWDGDFPAGDQSRLARAGFGGVHTVGQLMASEAGRTWWKANGWDIELSFDLDGGGRSMRVLKRYLALKGVRS